MSRSVDWLKRQVRDPFVRERIKRGLNSRSAFKLEHLEEKFKFIKPNKLVVDLGACPGGWTQVFIEKGVEEIVAVDLKDPPANLLGKVSYIAGDFTLPEVREACLKALGGKQPDIVVSDMAPNATGDRNRDHHLSMHLCRAALSFSDQVLNKNGGVFICKVFTGDEDVEFGKEMKARFKEFKRVKPLSSRTESRELFFFGRHTTAANVN